MSISVNEGIKKPYSPNRSHFVIKQFATEKAWKRAPKVIKAAIKRNEKKKVIK